MSTRRHYEALTRAFRAAGELAAADAKLGTVATLQGVRLAAEQVADAMKQENPRFERRRFLRESGMVPPL
jgi:hypothetical protein